jgi:nitronate monooxygenase
MKSLEAAAGGSGEKPSWKTVWSAGQSVGLVDEIMDCRSIVEKLVREYREAAASLPG